ncbi:MAG TPA: hypothetical protein VM935_05945 [Chitinophagaceae bacterium]|nr:hypothetical protein [Chitinophagaceae bacterium]
MKAATLLFLLLVTTFLLKAQDGKCVFKQPSITIHFGAGNIADVNTASLPHYERVSHYCPGDGHYTYTDYTSDCFNSDWLTLPEDHTPGDARGNMLLVNSSYTRGVFFQTKISGLKSNTIYEFALWLMNVCRISSKCPYPLLPLITIRVQTLDGRTVAKFNTGEIVRQDQPLWRRYRAEFTTPPNETSFAIIMENNNPGGCGNDFALDDITLRECIKPTPVVKKEPTARPVVKKPPTVAKQVEKKPAPPPAKKETRVVPVITPRKDSVAYTPPTLKTKINVFPPPPPILTNRVTTLAKQIETEAGEIKINLYDNGEIDGDTISIYHNNVLLMANKRLTQKPIVITIPVNADQPHHELIMVAENLGSIPPNTSLMIITAGAKRYEVFISSTEQKNAKLVIDLKKE